MRTLITCSYLSVRGNGFFVIYFYLSLPLFKVVITSLFLERVRLLNPQTKMIQTLFTNNLFRKIRGRRPRRIGAYISITLGICMIGYILIVQNFTNDVQEQKTEQHTPITLSLCPDWGAFIFKCCQRLVLRNNRTLSIYKRAYCPRQCQGGFLSCPGETEIRFNDGVDE